MSYKVIYTPPEQHVCDIPNAALAWTAGTVIECDCGLQWVFTVDLVGLRSWERRRNVARPVEER